MDSSAVQYEHGVHSTAAVPSYQGVLPRRLQPIGLNAHERLHHTTSSHHKCGTIKTIKCNSNKVSPSHRHRVSVLTSNRPYHILIFAVLVVRHSHCRPYKPF